MLRGTRVERFPGVVGGAQRSARTADLLANTSEIDVQMMDRRYTSRFARFVPIGTEGGPRNFHRREEPMHRFASTRVVGSVTIML